MTDPLIPPAADQPYIIWALGAAFAAVCALVGFIFRSIANAGRDAEKIAESVRLELQRAEINVRQELLHAEARTDQKMAAMHQENKERYAEGREDRGVMREEIRQNHETDLAQHAQMIASIAELPMRVSEMLRARHDNG